MILTKLVPRHSNDDGELLITDMFVTEDRELMVYGACKKCGKEVSVALTFNDLEQNVPTNTQKFTDEDSLFLHAFHISMGDSNETHVG